MHKQRSKALKAQKKPATVKKPQQKAARRISTRAKPVAKKQQSLTTATTKPQLTAVAPIITKSSRALASAAAKKPTTAFFAKAAATPAFASTITSLSVFSPQHISLNFVQPPLTTSVRTAVTFKKIAPVERKVITHEDVAKEKEALANKPAPKKAKKVPTLNDLMRQLYMKIHPDLMMDYPEQKEQNEKSLGTFQNFIAQLKTADGNEKYPMLKNASLPFYLRTATPGHFQRVELFLHTDSTLNKKGIEKQLCNFFKSINLSSTFQWDAEYFPFKGKPDFRKDNEEEAAAEAEAESSGPTGSETYEQFMERIKKQGEKNAKEQQQTM